MSNILKIFIMLCGLLFVGTVIYLLVKRKINERNSLFWLLGSIIILVLSSIPELLEVVARILGIDYPPSLLFLLSTLILLLLALYQSMQISVLGEQVKELSQIIAIQNYKESSSEFQRKDRGV